MKKMLCTFGAGLMMAGLANASVISAYEFSTSESFTTLPGVAANDLAYGVTAERDPAVSGGNFTVSLTDGLYGSGFGNNIPNQTTEAASVVRYKIDLGSAQEIGAVNSYAYGDNGGRSKQNFSLYGCVTDTESWDEGEAVWTLIATVDTTGVTDTASYGATSIYDDGGAALGTYRELMWVTSYGNLNGTAYESTIYKEFDVIAVPEPATLGLLAAFGGGILFIRRRFMM